MAQLVKLQDYISRYEIDLKRYPTQFVRLKKQQWDRTKEEWERGSFNSDWIEKEEEVVVEYEKKSLFSILFPKHKKEIVEDIEWQNDELTQGVPIPEESTTLLFEPKLVYKPQTKEELKRMYLDQLFHFQLKWASSTLREKSYVDPKYMRDSMLRDLTQKLPDNYFLFYYPILKLKKAPIELDIILILPTEVVCIVVLEDKTSDAFIGSGDRFWLKKSGKEEKKILNPTINLNRMESILGQIFQKQEVELPIKKVILSRNGYIDYPGNSYQTEFIDTRKFPEWFLSLKSSHSPMKHMQFKAAQAILDLVQTTSYSRSSSDLGSAEHNE
ncbi:nuclease-related domain-containing protein [Psychrobacillus psychrodurans]|uniref:NERD domain-containing protein n=1 Tax=Psychrobacillus psychrodurans TaxID=126157 RepID=A0A9X3L895_9BACI|nr:nuclease-related domain-containing protein [Psychrobacillus psychrodurans]MCZ8533227.1 NERD domain-containing protein [Psychrobacillus psychrodurans]